MPNGMMTVYEYDEDHQHRMTKISHKNSPTGSVVTSYEYELDASGNIESVTDDGDTAWAYEYDARNRLTAAVMEIGGITGLGLDYAYTYDIRDNLLTKTGPFFDDFSHATMTDWQGGPGWSASTGQLVGTTTSWFDIVGLETEDADYLLEFSFEMDDTGDGGAVFLRHEDGSNYLGVRFDTSVVDIYEYEDAVGTVLDDNTSLGLTVGETYWMRVMCAGPNVLVFLRESLEEQWQLVAGTDATVILDTTLVGFLVPNGETLILDDILIASDDLTNSYTYAYNAANELTSMTDRNGTATLAYDDWGRMTSKSRGSASASYEYRYGHYLADASSNFPGEAGADFLTGGDGKRRSATVASVETNYRWDAGYTVLNEEDDSGVLERTYVGRNTAQIEGADASTGDYLYHTHDHLGSTRQVFDESKVEVAEFKYTPYGRDIVPTNRALTTRGFTGHDQEAALGGAYYAPFRYYHPSLARWEKRDPLGMVDGPNVYAYVRGDVVNLWDPMGAWSWNPIALAAKLVIESILVLCERSGKTNDCQKATCSAIASCAGGLFQLGATVAGFGTCIVGCAGLVTVAGPAAIACIAKCIGWTVGNSILTADTLAKCQSALDRRKEVCDEC